MLEQIIYILPIGILLLGIGIFSLLRLFPEQNNRCFKLCRLIILSSFVLSVVFYNKPIIVGITSANRYLLLFQSVLYICALLLLFLSRKWFVGMKVSGQRFCYVVLLTVLAGNLLIVSRHLALTVSAMILMMFGQAWLIKDGGKKTSNQNALIYSISAFLFSCLLIVATTVLYKQCGTLNYTQLATYIEIYRHHLPVFSAAIILVFGFLFLLGMAPLHYWLTEILDSVKLPIFSLFILLPSCAVWIGFLRLNLKLLTFLTPSLHMFYLGIAVFSLAIGAIGATSCRNVRKIFAYGIVFQYGLMMLVLQHFNVHTIWTALFYWQTVLLSMTGICSILFGLKNKGDYLFMLNEFAGLGHKKPFLAGLLTVFLFSLVGLPPFWGGAGLFSVFNQLIIARHYYQIIFVAVMLLILAYAYLQIIKTLYFDENKDIFDRTDSNIYVLLVGILALMTIIMLRAAIWAEDISLLTEAIAA